MTTSTTSCPFSMCGSGATTRRTAHATATGTRSPSTRAWAWTAHFSKTSDGSSLPLLPLLGFRVYNGNSAFHLELLMNLGVPDPVGATLGEQISILEDRGVEQFAFWTGKDSNQLGGPSDATVTDYLAELFRRRT